MDIFEVVRKRKSIRKYLPNKKVQEKDIEKILKTISLAPSAGNLQAYKVFVVQSKEKQDKIIQACRNQRQGFVPSASVIFVFCADKDVSGEKYGNRGRNLYALQDATIAASFAILAVTSLGYGSCWIGSFDDNIVKKALNTSLRPVVLLPIGFANENPGRKERKPLDKTAQFI